MPFNLFVGTSVSYKTRPGCGLRTLSLYNASQFSPKYPGFLQVDQGGLTLPRTYYLTNMSDPVSVAVTLFGSTSLLCFS